MNTCNKRIVNRIKSLLEDHISINSSHLPINTLLKIFADEYIVINKNVICLPYGELPDFDLFQKQFSKRCPNGFLEFHGDYRLGSKKSNCYDLYGELKRALKNYNSIEDDGYNNGASSCFIADTGDWIAKTLAIFGIEWE